MILVTGGTGLVGSYVLLQLVRKRKKVKVLVRKDASRKEVYSLFQLYEPQQYQQLYDFLIWEEGDILDIPSLEKAFSGVSQVYHVAGKVTFNENEVSQLYKVNVEGTRNLVNVSIEHGVEKFCFISSIATLDAQLDQEYITEKAEWNFKAIHSSYACSKYGAEMEVWRGSQEGLNVLVVCPGVILGSGNWERSSGVLYDKILEVPFYTSGSTGYVDAEDVAEVCVQLMANQSVTNEKYILVSENASYEQITRLIRTHLKKKPARKISDFWLGKMAFLSRILPVKTRISKAAYSALTGNSEYSNQKIREEINYTFIPLEKSLQYHIKNYLQYKQIKND